MNNLRQAAQVALEALDDSIPVGVITLEKFYSAKEALRAALAEPQPEPYCYIYEYDSVLGLHREFYPRQWNGYLPSRVVTLYAAPTAQQPLTDEQIDAIPCTDGDGSDWAWESCDDAMEAMSCPWCDRQDIDICQHADDAKNCEKTK